VAASAKFLRVAQLQGNMVYNAIDKLVNGNICSSFMYTAQTFSLTEKRCIWKEVSDHVCGG